MTKRKPDQVIEYRVSLQDKQSEQLDSIIAAYQFGRVMNPLTKLFTDEGFLIFFTLMLESAGVTDWLPNDLTQWAKDGVADIWEQFQIKAAEATSPDFSGFDRPSDGPVPAWKIEASRIWLIATLGLNALKSKVS